VGENMKYLVHSVPSEFVYPIVLFVFIGLSLSNKNSLISLIRLYTELFIAVYWTANTMCYVRVLSVPR
jgi:hypothetical protein